jgi:hypothetical protein
MFGLVGDYGSMSSSSSEDEPEKIVEEEKEIPKRKREDEDSVQADATKKTKKTEETAPEASNDPFAGLVCSDSFYLFVISLLDAELLHVWWVGLYCHAIHHDCLCLASRHHEVCSNIL